MAGSHTPGIYPLLPQKRGFHLAFTQVLEIQTHVLMAVGQEEPSLQTVKEEDTASLVSETLNHKVFTNGFD